LALGSIPCLRLVGEKQRHPAAWCYGNVAAEQQHFAENDIQRSVYST